MIVIDASAVVAYFNRAEQRHDDVADLLDGSDEPLALTPLVLAEVDYVLERRAARRAVEALWRDLDAGGYDVVWWDDALRTTLDVARAAPRRIGLADASLVALAAHLRTTRIATLDDDFRELTPLTGEPAFTLLPA